MSDTPTREMTLAEWMAQLPVFHRAHREYVELLQDRALHPARPADRTCDEKHPFGYCDCPARPAEPTSEPLTANELYALDLCDQYLSLLAAQDVGPEDTVITDALTNRHLELIYNLTRRSAAALPSGEPTSEAVDWRSDPLVMAGWPSFKPLNGGIYGLISERDLTFICDRIASLAHPLPSDAPSGEPGDALADAELRRQEAEAANGSLDRIADILGIERHERRIVLIEAVQRLAASPPQDAPRLAEVATDKQFSGTWNNWIAPFHRCASCGDSLNWQQSVDVFDRPLITASCACGVMYSARLGEEGLEQARAVDAGNKLAALCAAPTTARE